MPTLATISIPLSSRSPSSGDSSVGKFKAPVKPQRKRRTYSGDPLPVKPSDNAPRSARIVGREVNIHGAFYQLRVGDMELDDVALDEILDYVSAEHLEDYENGQFEEEAELIRVAEVEQEREQELEAIERQQRRKEKALRKGTVSYQERDSADDALIDSAHAADVAAGRLGRARPTYKHLFKKVKVRRRRKRDPATGELMPLSEDDDDDGGMVAAQSSEEETQQPSRAPGAYVALPDPPKRKRRKHDPITGELLPLQLDARAIGEHKKKRSRRRRHPLTGQLMPLGWKSDVNVPSELQLSDGRDAEVGAMSPAMRSLSIAHEHTAKRVKLGPTLSSADSSPAAIAQQGDAEGTSSSGESSGEEARGEPAPRVISKSLPSAPRGMLSLAPPLRSATTSSVPESSPEPNTMTSIVHPMANVPANENGMDDDEEVEGDEWVIEAILAHHMSDPRTHPQELGKNPVMLYQVKWEGSDELSWEPIDSFSDRSVVDDYFRYQHKDRERDEQKSDGGVEAAEVLATSTEPQALVPATQPEKSGDSDDEDEVDVEEGTYVVETVTNHHMSDPKTHGPDFGKRPVMLYQVKWRGYEGFTWEPMDSFDDRKVIHSYRQRVGLPNIEGNDGDGDRDMS